MTITDVPFAAVIIPHFNDHARLDRCLSALWRAGVPKDVEVIVVDNGSQPPLGALSDFPGLRVVVETRKGAANARNRGVAETSAPRLWFLDADCVPADDWFSEARAVCDKADIIGGDVTVFDESGPPRTGAQGFETVFAFDCRSYVQEQGFAVTANMLTRRDIFYRAGPFIDGVPEDKEWCQRAVRTGADIVFAPELRVAHPSRSDWSALRKKWVRLTREAWAAHRQRRFASGLWVARAVMVALSGLVHLRRVFRCSKLTGAEKRSTALTLLRLRGLRSAWMLRQVVGLSV
ncbi:glycosyltransferase family 2 protein [Donghicola sp. C2-DW-16]|uniref:Glycosyltransferase family 2 protein n=1 Tax=Donghicola mangrovi TaxID=2729614 RepID=A0ABX2PFY6_9RHOB|nr:glycosyltransferase family 2 protein [Donghicola mangrovi]NVO28006.1 glycosyltransferase family 2 protein [Donghicola mangrovi]